LVLAVDPSHSADPVEGSAKAIRRAVAGMIGGELVDFTRMIGFTAKQHEFW